MGPTEPRYFLRSGGKRTRANDSPDTDEDGEWLADDPEVIEDHAELGGDDAELGWEDEPAVSPETPTPAPRGDASGAERPISQLGNTTTKAPAPVSSSRPLRRGLLFPGAPRGGEWTNEVPPVRQAPSGGTIPAVVDMLPPSVGYTPLGARSVTLGGYAAGGGGPSGHQSSNFAQEYAPSCAPPFSSVPAPRSSAPAPLSSVPVPLSSVPALVNPSPSALGNRWGGQHNFGIRGDSLPPWLDPQLLSSVPSPVTSWPGVAGAPNHQHPPQGYGHGQAGGQSLSSGLGPSPPYGQAVAGDTRLQPNSFGGTGGIETRVNPGARSGYPGAPSGGLQMLDDAFVPMTSSDVANDYAAWLRQAAAGQGHRSGAGPGSQGAGRSLSGNTWPGQSQVPAYHPGRPQGVPPPSANFVGTFRGTNTASFSSTSFSATSAQPPVLSSTSFSATSAQPPVLPSSHSSHQARQTARNHFPTMAQSPGNSAASASNRAVSNQSFVSAAEMEDPFIGEGPVVDPSAVNVRGFQNSSFVSRLFPTIADDIAAEMEHNERLSQRYNRAQQQYDAQQPLYNAQPLQSNANPVEYEMMQLEVRSRAEAGDSDAQNNREDSPTGNGQIDGHLSATGNEFELDYMSVVGHKDPDSDSPEPAADPSAESSNEESHDENGDNDDEDEDEDEDDDKDEDEDESSSDEDEDSSDQDEDDDYRPAPHIPDVHPENMYNPDINPAAAFWVDLPPAPFFADGYNMLPKPQPKPINMYSGLPAFDTDPFLPFAPWRVNQLPPFRPEPINRVLTVPLRFLSAVGALYPDSIFLVSRHPASANYTTRIKGAALVQSVALHFPALANNPILAPTKRGHDVDEAMYHEDKYILSLVQRDWPLGTVTLLPNTDDARAFVTEMRESFDTLPNDQEAFYFVPCDVTAAHTSATPNRNDAPRIKTETPSSGRIINATPTIGSMGSSTRTTITTATRRISGNTGSNNSKAPIMDPNPDSHTTDKANPTNPRKPQGMYILRAYEGRKGAQDARLITAWAQEQGPKAAEQDLAGREVLVRMGEAWVEPDKWGRPRVVRGVDGRRGGRRKQTNKEGEKGMKGRGVAKKKGRGEEDGDGGEDEEEERDEE